MLKAEQQTRNACADSSVNSAKQPNITNNFLDERGHLAFNQKSSRGQSSSIAPKQAKSRVLLLCAGSSVGDHRKTSIMLKEDNIDFYPNISTR